MSGDDMSGDKEHRVMHRPHQRMAPAPSTWLHATRRGSFLVTVVGILALLAVLTVVYVSIGRSDSQAAAATAKAAGRDAVPDQMRDYIAGIIADDVFDTFDPTPVQVAEGSAVLVAPELVREAWDAPTAPYQVTFVNPATGEVERRPVTVGRGPGNDFAVFTPTGAVLVGLPDGSTLTVGTGTDPWLRSTEPTVLDFGLDWIDPVEYAVRRRDWSQLSNVAPDGAFVNLWNLRDDPDENDDGFFASPLQMRQELTLTASADASAPNSITNRLTTTEWGEDASITDEQDALDARPMVFGSRQLDLYQPARDPDFGPEAASYLPYQFADTDGDGIFDARWFEMVLARTTDEADWRALLDLPDGELRWFFAASIVDLSSKLNVNLATDGTVAPDAEYPAGLSPSGADIRRLLSLHDFARDDSLQLTMSTAYGAVSSPPYDSYDEGAAFDVGDHGYDALRASLLSSQGLPALQQNPGITGLGIVTDGLIDLEFIQGPTLLALGADAYGSGTGPAQAWDYFAFTAPRLGGVGYDDDAQSYLRGSGFGLDDLGELLARHGLNDDRVESALEAVVFGRGGGGTGALVSPLRSNLTLAQERAGWTSSNGRRTQVFFDRALLNVRARLTTVSGARPIRPTPLGVLSGEQPSDLSITSADLPRRIDETLFDPGAAATEPPEGNPRLSMYLDALIPAPPEVAWDPAPEFGTLSYGHRGAEVAMRTAASAMVNLLDAGDVDQTPTRRTLVMTDTAVPLTIGSDVTRTGAADPGVAWPLLYPGASRVADPGIATFADGPVVNVFGIEAQPFLTEASAMTVYTDTPQAEGGNMDWALISITLPDGTSQDVIDPGVPPDINGDVDVANVDFLFEAVAFQLHNPFNEQVELTDNGEALYYIEFGNRYYKLTDVQYDAPSDSFGPETPLAMTPAGTVGDTVVFYALSQDTDDIAARLAGRAALAGAGITADEIIDEWAAKQFGVTRSSPPTRLLPIRVFPFDPQTGDFTPVASYSPFLDLHADRPSDNESRKVVRLWRVEKPQVDFGYTVATPGGVESATFNDLSTDVLVDRLRQPDVSLAAPVELDRRLPAMQIDVAGARAGDEADLVGDHDNKGLTLARYASIRRADDPEQGSFATREFRNVLPAYCIEVKNPSLGGTGHANPSSDDGSPDANVRRADFVGATAYNAERQLDQWWTEQTDASPASVESLSQAPYDKSGEDIGDNRNGEGFDAVGDRIIRPVFHLNNNEFANTDGRTVFRPADVLLPLGITPMHSPGANLTDPADDEWTTLSEAMALALAYEDPAGSAGGRTNALYATAFTGFSDRALLEGGALVYDTYIPFIDADGPDGVYTPDTDDMRYGLGVTPAMRLLDALNSAEESLLAIDRMVPGTVNLNTAPVETLRMLPMLTPPQGPDLIAGGDLWWWSGGQHGAESDVAATIAAYRDRRAAFPRTPTSIMPTAASRLNFLDPPPFSFAPTSPPGESPDDAARADVTGIPGLDERPGLRALGEMLAARDLNFAQWPGGVQFNPHSIDRLAFDGVELDLAGLVPTVPDGSGGLVTDGSADDPSEAMALVNPLLGVAQVRSDVFAVWVVMHGYQQSDTSGLRDDEVLTPSVARRFLFIVDRSDVTQSGQAPRILYSRELPM